MHIGIPSSGGESLSGFFFFPFFFLLLLTCIFGGFLPSYAVPGGIVSLVQGSYEYYHYLQDSFNDSVMQVLSLKSILTFC